MKRACIGLILGALLYGIEAAPKAKAHNYPKLKEKGKRGRPFSSFTSKRVNTYFTKIVNDSSCIGEKFFSLDTMKIFSATMPFYLIGRRVDAVVHRQFYDVEFHQNIHQPPKFLCNLALDDRYLAIPFVSFGLIGWLHHDPYERRRGQMFATGLMWSFAVKIALKSIKTDANLRPWHENFDRHERSHGGNPSGHMTITAYMATFWALEKGLRAAIPLSMFTAFAFSMNVACNHHYFSQAVAGTGLGVMMGYATHAAFRDLKMPEGMSVEPVVNEKKLGLKLVYDF